MQPLEYVNHHKDRFIAELFELLRVPSISADPAYASSVRNCAELVAQYLRKAGVDNVHIAETEGYPLVIGSKFLDASYPTVLVYGHYDVQPVVPLELWTSPPFEPEIRNEKMYARGACDDKGQMFMHIKALEYMLKNNKLQCNVKVLIEGEEEIGSDNLPKYLRKHAADFKADVVLISDTAMLANDLPTIDSGLRGLSYVEVEVTGPNRDLHSGVYGGAVANPINELCQIIARLHNPDGTVAIPGFYDRVVTLTANEREALAQAPFNEEAYKEALNVQALRSENNYTTTERATIRPTLDVNGIWGGYIGEGAKTVLPSKANAKISMRLVPNQHSETITSLFTAYLNAIAPPSVRIKVTPHHGGEPVVTPIDSVPYKAAEKAMEQTFGKKPIPTRGGGSIPIVALFEEILGVKTVLLGFGLDSDSIHAPDEHFGVFNFLKGIETIPYFYQFYAEMFFEDSRK